MTTSTQEGKPISTWLFDREIELLDRICEHEGRTSRSAIMRKLIVKEAKHLNLGTPETVNQVYSEQAA